MKPIKIMKYLKEDYNNNNSDEIKLYMNTWKNYNEYGADLEAYGIKDGWMDLDQALEFAEKYAEDEPFINDYDNSPVEISEYSNIKETIEALKEYEDSDYKEEVRAILQSGYTDDLHEAIEKAESGDYLYLPGVSNDKQLAEEYIDLCGGIVEAVGKDNISNYFDEKGYKDYIEDDVREMIREDKGYESIDDVTDEELESYLDAIVSDEISSAIYDKRSDFFEDWFDYEEYGNTLSYNFTYTDDGAIDTY